MTTDTDTQNHEELVREWRGFAFGEATSINREMFGEWAARYFGDIPEKCDGAYAKTWLQRFKEGREFECMGHELFEIWADVFVDRLTEGQQDILKDALDG